MKMMVDVLEAENAGIFTDPTKTFAEFSTAGLFLMEVVRRLDTGLAEQRSPIRMTAAAHSDLPGLRDEPQQDPAPHHRRGRLRWRLRT